MNHELEQLRAKDRRTPDRRLRPITSLAGIQLENLREKLAGEWLLAPVPADGAHGSQNDPPEAK